MRKSAEELIEVVNRIIKNNPNMSDKFKEALLNIKRETEEFESELDELTMKRIKESIEKSQTSEDITEY
jgi:hypothetical protein